MKLTIRRYRNRTDDECKAIGIPTGLEMVQQGIWFGPQTSDMYITNDDYKVDVPDGMKRPLSDQDKAKLVKEQHGIDLPLRPIGR